MALREASKQTEGRQKQRASKLKQHDCRLRGNQKLHVKHSGPALETMPPILHLYTDQMYTSISWMTPSLNHLRTSDPGWPLFTLKGAFHVACAR